MEITSAMDEALTLRKLDLVPDWVTTYFAEIDSKRFGAGFEDFYTPDAELVFGTARLRGFDAIRQHLMEFDSKMDTKHVVLEFWEAGDTRFLRGEVSMTKHASPGQTLVPAFVHILHMSREHPRKVQRHHGAAGPME